MKKMLTALTVLTFSSVLFATESPLKADNMPAPYCKMQHDRSEQLPFREPRQNVLFDVSMKTDNPIETIKNISPLIPEGKAKQYKIQITVTELPNVKDENKIKPLPEENKTAE